MPDRFGQHWRFGERTSDFAPRPSRFVARLSSALPGEAERIKVVREVRPIAIAAVQEARGLAMALKAGDMADTIIKTFQEAMQRAMTDANTQIGGATDEMVSTIKAGAANVKRAIQAETIKVQSAFGVVVGNAAAAAEDAVAEAKDAAGTVSHETQGGVDG